VNDINRSVLLVILLVILLPLLWGTIMMASMGSGMMGGWGDGDGWSPWRGFLAMISTLLVVGGIAAVVWWAFGRADSAGPSRRAEDDVRAILDGRYARGELTREQYQQMRGDLES
jgi:putative membrane protein